MQIIKQSFIYFIFIFSFVYSTNICLAYEANNIVTPEQFGAIGDGITNDTLSLQKTFNYAINNPNTIIELGANKTYLISSGLNIAKTSIVHGNNATIVVNEITDFELNGNFKNQFFMTEGYNEESNLLIWSNLNIIFSPNLLLNLDGTIKEYLLFRFYDLNQFVFNNVSIYSNGDERNQINLFKFSGKGNIKIDNCSFTINHKGKNGSILWIQSNLPSGYTAEINNSNFYSTTADEIISVFCTGNHQININNCYIEKQFYDIYYDEYQNLNREPGPFLTCIYQTPININRTTPISHNVNFNNCTLLCRPQNQNSTTFITFCGISSIFGDKAITTFDNCHIYLKNMSILAGGEQLNDNKYLTKIDDNETFHKLIKMIINNSTLTIENSSKYGLLRSSSCNLEITNSTINIDKQLLNYVWADKQTVTSYCFIMNNNLIYISNPSKYIFTVNKSAQEKYIITNNTFTVYSEQLPLLCNECSSSDGYDISFYPHFKKSQYYFCNNSNTINSKFHQ